MAQNDVLTNIKRAYFKYVVCRPCGIVYGYIASVALTGSHRECTRVTMRLERVLLFCLWRFA